MYKSKLKCVKNAVNAFNFGNLELSFLKGWRNFKIVYCDPKFNIFLHSNNYSVFMKLIRFFKKCHICIISFFKLLKT